MPLRQSARAARAGRAPRLLRVVRGGGGSGAPRDLVRGAASLLLPGLGQLLQGRRAAALTHLAVAGALGVGWLLVPPRTAVPVLLCAWALWSARDAARRVRRPRLRRV